MRVNPAFLSYPMAPCCVWQDAARQQGQARAPSCQWQLIARGMLPFITCGHPPSLPPSQPGRLLLAPLLLAARVVEALHIDMAAPPLTTENEADSPQISFNDEG